MASFPVKATSETSSGNNIGPFAIATGSFADPNIPGTPILWTGYATTTAQNGWTGYSGDTGGILAAVNYSDPNNTALVNAGFVNTTSIGFSGNGQPNATVGDTIEYGFSAPVVAGTTFYLWDPGSIYQGNAQNSTFTVTASLNGQAVSTSGWTFTTVSAQGGNPLIGTYTVNASSGTISVSNYNGTFQPEAVIAITTSTPITDLKVTGSTLGNDIWGLSVASPGSVATDSVTGAITNASGTNLIATLPYDSASTATAAQSLLTGISNAIAANTLAIYDSAAQAPTPGPAVGLVEQVDSASLVAMGGNVGLIDDAAGQVTTFGGTAANESVASGMGGLTFVAGAGGGQIIAGGDNTFISEASGAGNWAVTYGNGNNTVVAGTGSDTITSGTGKNLEFLGAGTDQVYSSGVDTIVGGSGSATINASAGTGTIGALAFGGSGGLTFVGGAGASTVVSFTGSLTVQAGSGGGVFFGGTGGNNKITTGTGPVTMFGGGGGDLLSATGSASDLMAARAGNETLTGARSTGTNAFFAGSGADELIGGSGNNSFIEGSGSATMVGGSGLNLFLFNAGVGNGAADTIQNWNPARDFVNLSGFAAGSTASVLKTATVGNGNTTITLADGTHVIFAGVSSLSASSFIGP